MKKTENNPVVKFKNLLKGSALARNLSFVYVVLSLILAYKMRAQLEYVVPLLIGAIVIIWYTLTHLMLKHITHEKNDLKSQFDLYRSAILKREKYESTVFFIWLLTIVPAYLFERDITIFTVIKWMIVLYIVIIVGNSMFKKVKEELKELEIQINSIEASNL